MTRCVVCNFIAAVDHATIIERLGGYQYVAEHVERDPTTVCRWQSNGIPPEHWPAILRLARRQRLRLKLEQIERASPLWGKHAPKPAA